MIGASFDSTKTALQELLARAHSGKLQLPDFQRGWVWDDDRIRSLLKQYLVRAGFRVTTAEDAAAARRMLESRACWRASRSRSRSAP